MRFCFLICFLLLLAGCAVQKPQAFGIPLSAWNQTSATQRQNLIEQYNVNKLPHYNSEAKTTMDSSVEPSQGLSILDEHQQQTVMQPAKPKEHQTPAKIQIPTPAQKPPTETNWLQLNG